MYIPGDLHYTKEGVPVMIIGHHILYGKVQALENPLVTLEKKIVETSGREGEDAGEMMEVDAEPQAEYRLKSIVRKKIIFKTLPKPIITNVPKTV